LELCPGLRGQSTRRAGSDEFIREDSHLLNTNTPCLGQQKRLTPQRSVSLDALLSMEDWFRGPGTECFCSQVLSWVCLLGSARWPRIFFLQVGRGIESGEIFIKGISMGQPRTRIEISDVVRIYAMQGRVSIRYLF